MSKIEVYKDNEFLDEIENNVVELNKHFVLVKKEDIPLLDQVKVVHHTFTSNDYFIVKRGRRKKRFNTEQQKEIFNDLEQGLSIRKCATKYKCSTKTIQEIKKGLY